MTDFDLLPGSIHRGLGIVARWPGVALVIPGNPEHDAAVEAMFVQLGSDPSAEEVTRLVGDMIVNRRSLKAAAYLTNATGGPVAMAFGPMEVLSDGQPVLAGGDTPVEQQISTGDRFTIRASGLAKAAEPVAPFDLRRGVAPGGGITIGAARFAATDGLTEPPPPEEPGGVSAEAVARSPIEPAKVAAPFRSVLLSDHGSSDSAHDPLPLATPRRTIDEVTSGEPAGGGGVAPVHDGHPAPSHRHSTEISQPTSHEDVVVYGIVCSRDHFNNPAAAFCMVCGISMVHVTHNLVPGPRPTLGFVVFDDGSTFGLDRCYLVGREPGETADGLTAPLTIPDNNETLSRRHAEIRLIDWTVHIIDLDSTNGTFIWDPTFERWNRITPNQAVALTPGDTVALGRRTFVYESVTRL